MNPNRKKKWDWNHGLDGSAIRRTDRQGENEHLPALSTDCILKCEQLTVVTKACIHLAHHGG